MNRGGCVVFTRHIPELRFYVADTHTDETRSDLEVALNDNKVDRRNG